MTQRKSRWDLVNEYSEERQSLEYEYDMMWEQDQKNPQLEDIRRQIDNISDIIAELQNVL